MIIYLIPKFIVIKNTHIDELSNFIWITKVDKSKQTRSHKVENLLGKAAVINCFTMCNPNVLILSLAKL